MQSATLIATDYLLCTGMYVICVVGCDNMPANLQKFGTPWTPLKKSLVTNGQICRVRSLPGNNGKVCTYRVIIKVALFCIEMVSNQLDCTVCVHQTLRTGTIVSVAFTIALHVSSQHGRGKSLYGELQYNCVINWSLNTQVFMCTYMLGVDVEISWIGIKEVRLYQQVCLRQLITVASKFSLDCYLQLKVHGLKVCTKY